MTLIIVNIIWFLSALPVVKEGVRIMNFDLLHLSEKLLYNVKIEQPTDSLKIALSKYSVNDLITGLSDDNARKTF